jgi:hypothetical protein
LFFDFLSGKKALNWLINWRVEVNKTKLSRQKILKTYAVFLFLSPAQTTTSVVNSIFVSPHVITVIPIKKLNYVNAILVKWKTDIFFIFSKNVLIMFCIGHTSKFYLTWTCYFQKTTWLTKLKVPWWIIQFNNIDQYFLWNVNPV